MMDTHHLDTIVPVDTIWHTNWGFCVRHIIAGHTYSFFLDRRITGAHRAYIEKYSIPWRHRGHSGDWEASPLISGTTATLWWRLVASWDDIPLDPHMAQEKVHELWWPRIRQARQEDIGPLVAQRDRLCESFRQVIAGEIASIVALDWILGICGKLELPKKE